MHAVILRRRGGPKHWQSRVDGEHGDPITAITCAMHGRIASPRDASAPAVRGMRNQRRSTEAAGHALEAERACVRAPQAQGNARASSSVERLRQLSVLSVECARSGAADRLRAQASGALAGWHGRLAHSVCRRRSAAWPGPGLPRGAPPRPRSPPGARVAPPPPPPQAAMVSARPILTEIVPRSRLFLSRTGDDRHPRG
jgi:hypothetical protein